MGFLKSRTAKVASLACHVAPFATMAAQRAPRCTAQGAVPLDGQMSFFFSKKESVGEQTRIVKSMESVVAQTRTVESEESGLLVPPDGVLNVLKQQKMLTHDGILDARYAKTKSAYSLNGIVHNYRIVYNGGADSEAVLDAVKQNYSEKFEWCEQIFLLVGKAEGEATNYRMWLYCTAKGSFMPLRFGFDVASKQPVKVTELGSVKWEDMKQLQLVKIRGVPAAPQPLSLATAPRKTQQDTHQDTVLMTTARAQQQNIVSESVASVLGTLAMFGPVGNGFSLT